MELKPLALDSIIVFLVLVGSVNFLKFVGWETWGTVLKGLTAVLWFIFWLPLATTIIPWLRKKGVNVVFLHRENLQAVNRETT